MSRERQRIVVLGAGPTGLAAGLRLRQAGHGDWDVYERNPYAGGLSASFRDARGFTWDVGGHVIFSGQPRFLGLMERLLEGRYQTFGRESWIWLRGHFVRYPFQDNFHTHPDREMVLECLLGLLDGRRGSGAPAHFEEWILRHFGPGIARHFMLPYNRKVWSVPLERMAYQWIAERVSVVDPERVLAHLVRGTEEVEWGPNRTFHYPLHGGIGGLFQRMVPALEGRLHLGREAVEVDPARREVAFADGSRTRYHRLVSTIPLPELLRCLTGTPEGIRAAARAFVWNQGYMVGVGVRGPCPSTKNWIYFPGDEGRFYRVTYLSNYSPHVTPEGEWFSLLAETSYPAGAAVSPEAVVEETLEGLVRCGLLADPEAVVSTHVLHAPYSIPVPFLERDRVLAEVQAYLEEHGIYSRGRFGGWKYEIGNMDHSVLQGLEVVERILYDEPERIYSYSR